MSCAAVKHCETVGAYLHDEADVEAALKAAGYKARNIKGRAFGLSMSQHVHTCSFILNLNHQKQVTRKDMTSTNFYFSRLFEAGKRMVQGFSGNTSGYTWRHITERVLKPTRTVAVEKTRLALISSVHWKMLDFLNYFALWAEAQPVAWSWTRAGGCSLNSLETLRYTSASATFANDAHA